jgi:hypothetical protein
MSQPRSVNPSVKAPRQSGALAATISATKNLRRRYNLLRSFQPPVAVMAGLKNS